MSLDTQKKLQEAIVKYNQAKDGASGDAERDAGGELQEAAIEHLRSEVQVAVHESLKMFEQFERSLNE